MTGQEIFFLAVVAGMVLMVVVDIIRRVFRRRRERRELTQRIHDAIEKITADGKIEGPKGKFRWINWSRKWIEYNHALPAPKMDKRMPYAREFPNYPHPGE